MNFTAGRIDPGLLATFIAVADKKSVSGATDLLHLSQPAVTAQIKRLEDSLGAPLFLRSVQGMRVTAKGLQLYDYAREIARLLAEADRVVGKSEKPEGQLRIAARTTISAYVLPAALAAFCRLNPRIYGSIEQLEPISNELADPALSARSRAKTTARGKCRLAGCAGVSAFRKPLQYDISPSYAIQTLFIAAQPGWCTSHSTPSNKEEPARPYGALNDRPLVEAD